MDIIENSNIDSDFIYGSSDFQMVNKRLLHSRCYRVTVFIRVVLDYFVIVLFYISVNKMSGS